METLTQHRQRQLEQIRRRNEPRMRREFWELKREQANNVYPIR